MINFNQDKNWKFSKSTFILGVEFLAILFLIDHALRQFIVYLADLHQFANKMNIQALLQKLMHCCKETSITGNL